MIIEIILRYAKLIEGVIQVKFNYCGIETLRDAPRA